MGRNPNRFPCSAVLVDGSFTLRAILTHVTAINCPADRPLGRLLPCTLNALGAFRLASDGTLVLHRIIASHCHGVRITSSRNCVRRDRLIPRPTFQARKNKEWWIQSPIQAAPTYCYPAHTAAKNTGNSNHYDLTQLIHRLVNRLLRTSSCKVGFLKEREHGILLSLIRAFVKPDADINTGKLEAQFIS